jgi:hypothetical protein
MTITTKLHRRIKLDLQLSGWTPEEIAAYLSAQEAHGCLSRSHPNWKLKAYYQSWPRFRPTITPREMVQGRLSK